MDNVDIPEICTGCSQRIGEPNEHTFTDAGPWQNHEGEWLKTEQTVLACPSCARILDSYMSIVPAAPHEFKER